MTVLQGLATRLALSRLMLSTDARTETADLATFARAACAGGVDIICLNGADDAPGVQRTALETLREAAPPTSTIVATAGDLDVAADVGADMLVLPDGGPSARLTRRRLHRWALVGRSCHSTSDVDAALADADVDFLVITASLANVAYAAAAAPPGDPAAKPWFAAGGVTAAAVPTLLAAGCRRVLVGRALSRSADPRAAAASLDALISDAWASDPAMEAVTFAAFATGADRQGSD